MAKQTLSRVESAAIDKRVDRAVRELKIIVVVGQVEQRLRVGEYVLGEFFDGSEELARSVSGWKDVSVQRLLQRSAEFGMTRSAFQQAVPFALQARQLGRDLSLKLTLNQHRAMLPLRDRSAKHLLAEAAASESWSPERVRKEVFTLQRRQPGGRPPEPRVQILVGRLERVFAEGKSDLARGAEELDAKAVAQLSERVARLQEELVRVEKLLAKLRG
jgi:hypothetical protein